MVTNGFLIAGLVGIIATVVALVMGKLVLQVRRWLGED